MRIGFLAVPALVLLSATAMAQSTVVIAPSAPPPAVHEEIVPPTPSTDVVWQPGHWSWSGTQYVWVSGAYVARPRPQVAWVPGHWDQNPTGWTWVDGYWQIPLQKSAVISIFAARRTGWVFWMGVSS